VLIRRRKSTELTSNIGLCLDIEEVKILVKNAHRPTCLTTNYTGTHKNNMGLVHSILRIVTHDEQAFAIDATAAQYGWTEIMVPWDTYFTRHVKAIREVMPFGTFAKTQKDIAAEKSYDGGYQEAHIKISKRSSGILSDWLEKKSLTSSQFLDLPDDKYVLHEESLMTAWQDGVKASVYGLRQSGLYRCYVMRTLEVDNHMEMNLTRSRRENKEQKKYWVTAKEYDERINRICKSNGTRTGLAGMIKKW
jgi:hypothetical protein